MAGTLQDLIDKGLAYFGGDTVSRASHESAVNTLKAELDGANVALAGSRDGLADAQAKLATQETQLAELAAKVATLEGENTTLRAEARTAAERSQAIAAAQGLPLASTPAADRPPDASEEALWAHYHTLNPMERTEFYQRNPAMWPKQARK